MLLRRCLSTSAKAGPDLLAAYSNLPRVPTPGDESSETSGYIHYGVIPTSVRATASAGPQARWMKAPLEAKVAHVAAKGKTRARGLKRIKARGEEAEDAGRYYAFVMNGQSTFSLDSPLRTSVPRGFRRSLLESYRTLGGRSAHESSIRSLSMEHRLEASTVSALVSLEEQRELNDAISAVESEITASADFGSIDVNGSDFFVESSKRIAAALESLDGSDGKEAADRVLGKEDVDAVVAAFRDPMTVKAVAALTPRQRAIAAGAGRKLASNGGKAGGRPARIPANDVLSAAVGVDIGTIIPAGKRSKFAANRETKDVREDPSDYSDEADLEARFDEIMAERERRSAEEKAASPTSANSNEDPIEDDDETVNDANPFTPGGRSSWEIAPIQKIAAHPSYLQVASPYVKDRLSLAAHISTIESGLRDPAAGSYKEDWDALYKKVMEVGEDEIRAFEADNAEELKSLGIDVSKFKRGDTKAKLEAILVADGKKEGTGEPLMTAEELNDAIPSYARSFLKFAEASEDPSEDKGSAGVPEDAARFVSSHPKASFKHKYRRDFEGGVRVHAEGSVPGWDAESFSDLLRIPGSEPWYARGQAGDIDTQIAGIIDHVKRIETLKSTSSGSAEAPSDSSSNSSGTVGAWIDSKFNPVGPACIAEAETIPPAAVRSGGSIFWHLLPIGFGKENGMPHPFVGHADLTGEEQNEVDMIARMKSRRKAGLGKKKAATVTVVEAPGSKKVIPSQ